MSDELKEQAELYVSRLSGTGSEDALHSLMEFPNEALPILVELYQAETVESAKRSILHAIWQHRQESSIWFLLNVLVNENIESLWQEALDGLVAIGSIKAITELHPLSVKGSLKSRYVSEAIEQIREANA